MHAVIPVIDLFAGPGGLGEGFASFLGADSKPAFRIVLSIEKDLFAHRTLELRSFFRQFPRDHAPEAYYQYIRHRVTRDDLFAQYPDQARAAARQAWRAELGSPDLPHEEVDHRIRDVLDGAPQWLLIGGPPCQAYSTVGRSRMKNRHSEFEKDHRHFLYREYLRIIAVHQPTVFIMENVSGLLSLVVNGCRMFDKLLADLRHPHDALPHMKNVSSAGWGYHIYSLVKPAQDPSHLKPSDYVIQCEKHGIPQRRRRVILLGIRSDCCARPATLRDGVTPYLTTAAAISGLPRIRSRLSREPDSFEAWVRVLRSVSNSGWLADAKIDAALRDKMDAVLDHLDAFLPTGEEFVPYRQSTRRTPTWALDRRIGGACNHRARAHIREDLHRYFFAACFASMHHRTPILREYPGDLLPKHHNVAQAMGHDMFSDRFRVQIEFRPSTTITSHISKDGHYYIHPDPTQCRSLTVREAARLQTFPDNYFFEGERTQQYQQVGNAVPPLLAHQIAEVVHAVFAGRERESYARRERS